MRKLIRFFKLLKFKIFRIKDFPESVAIGLAWGAAVSFTPLLGFHLIICYSGTLLMRGNLIAATVGTIIGNPWTFPFFYYLAYKIGVLFVFEPLDYYEFNIQFLIDNFEDLFYPTLIGSAPLAILVWIITFKISKFYLDKRIYEKKNKIRS
jgi:uncharacterized protein (DUF2062 family)